MRTSDEVQLAYLNSWRGTFVHVLW